MRIPLAGLFRVTVFLALVSGTVAVALARLEPTAAHFRLAVPPAYGVINGFLIHDWPDRPGLLDAETGVVRRFDPPAGDRFEYGACSPWRDDEGEFQVVGRWMKHGGNGVASDRLFEAFGLARYSLPSGRVLNRMAVDAVPATQPCWFPDMSARVLYAAGDGRLYRVDFDGSDRDPLGGDPAPQEVVWKCTPPGARVAVHDPVWPTDPRFGGRLVVSLQYARDESGFDMVPGRLWWLALSSDGGAIVAAGRLDGAAAEAPRADRVEQRYPNVARTPDGGLELAYLECVPREPSWRLRLAPVEIDGRSKRPVVRADAARTLSGDHVAALPPFSADGRYVFGIVSTGASCRVVRFPTGAPEAPPLTTAARPALPTAGGPPRAL